MTSLKESIFICPSMTSREILQLLRTHRIHPMTAQVENIVIHLSLGLHVNRNSFSRYLFEDHAWPARVCAKPSVLPHMSTATRMTIRERVKTDVYRVVDTEFCDLAPNILTIQVETVCREGHTGQCISSSNPIWVRVSRGKNHTRQSV